MFLYLLFTSKELSKSKNLYFYSFSSILNTLFFYASIFCKQQILLLSPLFFIYILKCTKIKDLEYYKKLKTFIKRKNFSNILFLFFLSGIPWVIISIEEFYKFGLLYFVNLPFWSFINTGLIFAMIISAKDKIKISSFIKYLFMLTLIQILIFEIISPNVWRRSITAFPSFLFPFSSLSDGSINLFLQLKDFIIFTKDYSMRLFWPGNIIFLFILFIIIYFIIRFLGLFLNKGDYSLLDYSIFSLVIYWYPFFARKSFYQIYYYQY